jgi:hypothetical protein
MDEQRRDEELEEVEAADVELEDEDDVELHGKGIAGIGTPNPSTNPPNT